MLSNLYLYNYLRQPLFQCLGYRGHCHQIYSVTLLKCDISVKQYVLFLPAAGVYSQYETESHILTETHRFLLSTFTVCFVRHVACCDASSELSSLIVVMKLFIPLPYVFDFTLRGVISNYSRWPFFFRPGLSIETKHVPHYATVQSLHTRFVQNVRGLPSKLSSLLSD